MDGAGPDLRGPRCAEREGAPPGGEARPGLSESCSGGRWGLRCQRRCCSEAPSSALKLSSHRQELGRKLQVRTLPPDRSYRKEGSTRFVELQDQKGLQLLPGEVTLSPS